MSNTGEVRLEDITVVKLSKVYNLAGFDCGDKDINDFLKNDALTHQEEMIANTILFLYRDIVLGFCSLTADAIKLSSEEKIDTIVNKGDMKHYPQYPAIKLARFGRDKKYDGQGIGKNVIIPWVIGYSKSLEYVGVRFVTADAYPAKVQYYADLGFVKNQHKEYKRNDQDPTSMRFDLKGQKPKES